MTHAPKLSKRESTVMLGELLNSMKLKDNRGELIDFVYKSSHIFSERHPERANDCWDDNVITHNMEIGYDIKGKEHFQKFSHDIHDTLEDLHYVIEDIVTEGTLKDGKVSIRISISGIWSKPVGDTPPSNQRISIINFGIWKINNGKTCECWSLSHSSPDYVAAWAKVYSGKN